MDKQGSEFDEKQSRIARKARIRIASFIDAFHTASERDKADPSPATAGS
jgi:hypothetical protein